MEEAQGKEKGWTVRLNGEGGEGAEPQQGCHVKPGKSSVSIKQPQRLCQHREGAERIERSGTVTAPCSLRAAWLLDSS